MYLVVINTHGKNLIPITGVGGISAVDLLYVTTTKFLNLDDAVLRKLELEKIYDPEDIHIVEV